MSVEEGGTWCLAPERGSEGPAGRPPTEDRHSDLVRKAAPPAATEGRPGSLPEWVTVVPGGPAGGVARHQGLGPVFSSCSATHGLWGLGQTPAPLGPQFPHPNPSRRSRQAEIPWPDLSNVWRTDFSGQSPAVIPMASMSGIGGLTLPNPELSLMTGEGVLRATSSTPGDCLGHHLQGWRGLVSGPDNATPFGKGSLWESNIYSKRQTTFFMA